MNLCILIVSQYGILILIYMILMMTVRVYSFSRYENGIAFVFFKPIYIIT